MSYWDPAETNITFMFSYILASLWFETVGADKTSFISRLAAVVKLNLIPPDTWRWSEY